jgi:methionyl-tRNA formyltransferase
VKLVFIGTSEFARPALVSLAHRHDVRLVVTQPDRPVGRRAVLQAPPIKRQAVQLGLSVIQPERINKPDAVEALRSASADAFVVASYGQILKPTVFDLPPLGTINIHASLLPAYRGAAPVQWAIVRGESTTGITTFLIEAGLDTGDLLLRRSLPIDPDETAGELEARLARLGAETIEETLAGLETGRLVPTPQPDVGVSLASPLTRDDGRIDWSRPSREIHDLVRGTNPWPGAWTTLGTERVKVHRTSMTEIDRGPVGCGEVGPREAARLLVGAGDRLIEILEIQRAGRQRTSGLDFLK